MIQSTSSEMIPHVERTWEETIEHTYNLYNLFIRKNITAVKAQRIIYGVTDSLNNRFIDGKRKKSSASLKQLILALEEADITELFNPFLKLIALFSNNPSIQKTFGYNAEMSDPAIHYPFQKRSKLNAGDIAAVPMSLSNQFPNDNITQISQLQLNRHEEIRKSYFVLIQTRSEHEEYIGYDIKSTLNLQHDCHTGKCSVTNTRSTKIERLATTIKTLEVRHRDDLLLADLPIKSISPQEWLEVCSLGLSCWGIVEAPAAAPCPTPADSPVETPPETAVQTP
ncbi:hypothetical protein MJO28_011235 [Puccinia striiformis f. sp. tritici]|uniref:Uncharacterized protein n=1 Tax=Puccinia striiformis f. sp. tritici TaxID=168172 RepID=A0ACC0E250_9BASI|nr:hypothetical protein MJO28_011235 [Puccinia striiformis f. sp. tritici]